MKTVPIEMSSNLKRNQKGFTLVELIIVVALAGIIVVAATTTFHQVLLGTTLSNDRNSAVNQLRNAVHWISRDAQMAQIVVVDDSLEVPKVLEMSWEDWEGTPHAAYYSLEDGRLERNYDGQMTFIAEYIDPVPVNTDFVWDDVDRVLTVTMTARAGDEIETRTFDVKSRPDPVS
jgi:prepilin-type N-terminal cleavage/methylation domain-containing protein